MEAAPYYLRYNSQYQCLICHECQYALPYRLVSRHLRTRHQIQSRTAIQRQLQCVPAGAKPREDHTDFPPLAHGADPVPDLPVRDLLQCNHCSFLTPSTKWLQQHHRSHHASDVPRPLASTPVQGQTWFDHARFCRYWVTAAAPRPTSPRPSPSLPTPDDLAISTSPGSGRLSPDGPLLPTPPPSSPTPTSNDTDSASTGRSPETLPSVLLSRPALESREIQRPGMVLPGKEATTPWLAQTGWLPYLEGRPLQTLVELRGDPNTIQNDPTIARVWQGPLSGHYTAILRIIGASFDRVMARALDTLDITHEPIRQIFHSTIAGTPYKRALDRLQPRTETRYIQIWRHFLYWTFRAAPFPAERRLADLGVPLDRRQEELLQRIWTTLDRFLRQPDAMDFAQQAPLPVIATASSEPPVTANSPPTRPRKRSLSVSSDLDNPGERPAAKRRTTRYQIAIAVCIPSRPRTPGRSRPIVAGRTVEPSPEPHAPPSTPTLARGPSAIDPRSPPHGPSARRFPRQSHFKANHRSAATPYPSSPGDQDVRPISGSAILYRARVWGPRRASFGLTTRLFSPSPRCSWPRYYWLTD